MASDEEQFRAWQAGDRKAGEALFERHYDSLDRFFINKVGVRAGDLVQRTLLACLEAAPRFRGESSFRTFLFAIARNQLLKHLRDHGRERERFDPAVTSICDLDPSPSLVAARREHERLLLAGLRGLPVDEQIALELHYWEQLPASEIAVVLDIPVGTAKSRLRRARDRLETALAQPALASAGSLDDLERWARELRAGMRRSDAES
ncbi:RNA polymerase sigma factor [Nannocystis radixulma]|uniref:RNA polymerase sigma factor n=1 Tax=Nannocystis radixulma TaxID=2995305 RepID=A0ABT5BPR9_9BACT|nr:RNA polymerase sigma factor [Nannocystis radixulma]MDC0675580.1 RNA polymerase sigma factor [Nannocystis radixulma]